MADRSVGYVEATRVAPEAADQVARLRAVTRALGRRPLEDIAARRAAFESFARRLPGREGFVAEEVDADGVRCLLLPGQEDRAAILYLHGGAYTYGSAESHLDLAGRLGALSGLEVAVPSYRLAPEHPFPAALDDAARALDWLQRRRPSVVLAGDSAGGGLAVALAVRRRAEGGTPPAAVIAFSPWTDLALGGSSIDRAGEADPLVDRPSLSMAAEAYLAGADARHPLVSPSRADLSGLPPLLVQVASGEALEDDAVRLAERAAAAGVAVTLEVWEEQLHVWQLYSGMLADGRRALARAAVFAREALRG